MEQFNPVDYVGKHRLASGKFVLVTSAHLPKEGAPTPVKFSDGTEFAPQREEAERIALLAARLKVMGLDGEFAKEIRRDEDGTRYVRVALQLSDETVALLKSLDEYACATNSIIWVSMPIISAIRDMGLQDAFSRIAAMISTPETRRAAPQDKVIMVETWSVP